MKIQVLSDLHMEFLETRGRNVLEGLEFSSSAEVLVVAGDVHKGTDGIDYLNKVYDGRPLIYVPGNHEFFGSDYDALYDQFYHSNKDPSRGVVTLVGGQYVDLVIEQQLVRVVGATLWTDFDLEGDDNRLALARMAEAFLPDFQFISRGKFSAQRSREICLQEISAIEEAINQCSHSCAVVTHYLPHPDSISVDFRNDPLNASYASRLPASLFAKASLWVHGHAHHNVDYRVKNCRIVSNPRGYPTWNGFQNAAFNPQWMVEF